MRWELDVEGWWGMEGRGVRLSGEWEERWWPERLSIGGGILR